VISIAALYWSSDRSATTQTIFTSLLPLFGTWVGTVLAFYFARDNLEAATESTLRATGALSLSDPVATAMIRPGGIRALRVPAGGTADAIKLFDVAKLMQTSGFKRIPILRDADVVEYVVHESTITAYAVEMKIADIADAATFTQTIADLKASTAGKLIGAFAFVRESATLADARDAMAGVPGSNDVFVTASGQASEPLLGWLTNTMLAGIR
jgi:hypothetical protein